jgi:hypothetical protein
LVERAGRVDRQIVENDTDTLGLGKVNVSKFAHTGGEIDCGPALGDFHLAPRPMDVDEHEQIGCSIAPIFAIVALKCQLDLKEQRKAREREQRKLDPQRLALVEQIKRNHPRWGPEELARLRDALALELLHERPESWGE